MGPQQQSPSDYLNQISAAPPKQGMSNRLFFMAIGGALIVAIITVALMLISGSASKGITPEQLAIRLQELQTISEDNHQNIKDSQLRAINSRLTTQLTNTNRDIVEPMKIAKVDVKKISKSTSSKEKKYLEDLNAELEDARLNDDFDATYSQDMAYELDNVAIMMKAVEKKQKSKSMTAFVDSAYDNLVSLQKELADYKPY